MNLKLISNRSEYSFINYCVSTKDGSIPQEPTEEQLNSALKKQGFELFDAEVVTDKPDNSIIEDEVKKKAKNNINKYLNQYLYFNKIDEMDYNCWSTLRYIRINIFGVGYC